MNPGEIHVILNADGASSGLTMEMTYLVLLGTHKLNMSVEFSENCEYATTDIFFSI